MDTAPADSPSRKNRRRPGLILPTTYERLPEDCYFTIEASWIVPALLKRVSVAGPVLEPCAGRGHLVVELRRHGLEVAARDLIAHENPLVDDIETPRDLDALQSAAGFGWVVTNPPFTQLDERVKRLLQLGARDGCNVALLLRQEWASPAKRGVLIHNNPNFAGMIVLTARPRWIEDPGGESPRHHFIWGVWTAAPRPANARPWIVFEGRASAKQAVGADAIRAPDLASLAKPTPRESETTPDRADPCHDDSGYANSADDEHDGSILPTINGEFAGEIVAGTFMPFGAGRASGGSCVLRLEMREGTRFDIRLKFLTSGPPHIVLRDARAMAAWVEAVGTPPAAGFTALGENLWIASRGKRVLFDLRTHKDHRGLPEVVIVGVRVERTTHA